MGMLPRRITDDSIYSQTQRTVDRQFLLKPDEVVKNIIGSSAARAQQKHPVKIFWIDANINHETLGIGPLSGSQEDLDNVIRFKQTYHRLIALEINRYYDREGPLFSTPSRDAECIDDKSIEDRFFYSLMNPVKDGLVEKISEWKGFTSYWTLAKGEHPTYTYFDRTAWHKAGGAEKNIPIERFVKKVRIAYSSLPGWEDFSEDKRQTMIRKQCRELEKQYRMEREANGRKAMGPTKLAKLNPRERPNTKPEKTKKPLVHAANKEERDEYIKELIDFVDLYKIASADYRNGNMAAKFPRGSIRPPLLSVQT